MSVTQLAEVPAGQDLGLRTIATLQNVPPGSALSALIYAHADEKELDGDALVQTSSGRVFQIREHESTVGAGSFTVMLFGADIAPREALAQLLRDLNIDGTLVSWIGP